MRLAIIGIGLLALVGCGDDDPPAESASPTASAPAAAPAADDATAAADPASVTCVAGDGGQEAVAITGFTFQPGDTAVDAGGSVTFTNDDSTPHSVWSADRIDGDPAFESAGADPAARLPELLQEGDASTCTFPAPGTYEYLCGVHNNMTGTISVGPRR